MSNGYGWASMMTERKLNKYLTFQLGPEEYGLEILGVREIIGMMEITRMPRMPEFIRGVINLDVIGYNDPNICVTCMALLGDLKGTTKAVLKKARNNALNRIYPDGLIRIAGREPNRNLVRTVSAVTREYTGLGLKEMVRDDCG